MKFSAEMRRSGPSAVFAACLLAGCVSDQVDATPMAPTACPEGLALRVESIGLSYAIIRVDSCAAGAIRFGLDRTVDGDSAHDVIPNGGASTWGLWGKYPTYPGSGFGYRITAFFKDSTRLASNPVFIEYPDSSGDFAPIAVGRSYAYGFDYAGPRDYTGTRPDTMDYDSGGYALQVLSKWDSAGIDVYQVGYRDSIVRSSRRYSEPHGIEGRATLCMVDTVRCTDDGESVVCDPVQGAARGARHPWARAHILRRPEVGLVKPFGAEATACAHEANQTLLYGAGSQAIYIPGAGMVDGYFSGITPHSAGTGSRMRIRLLELDGRAVYYGPYADLCARDFPPVPAR